RIPRLFSSAPSFGYFHPAANIRCADVGERKSRGTSGLSIIVKKNLWQICEACQSRPVARTRKLVKVGQLSRLSTCTRGEDQGEGLAQAPAIHRNEPSRSPSPLQKESHPRGADSAVHSRARYRRTCHRT